MSSAGAQLQASLTLKGDSSALVGAATEGAAALNKLSGSANAASASGAAMAPAFSAATKAIQGQAAASAAASQALTASGAAEVEEIARLTQLVSASTATTTNIRALSVAHGEYNSTVNAARELLAAGVLNQFQYGEAVRAASAKLALANVVHDAGAAALAKEAGGSAALGAAQRALGEGAEETGVHISGLSRQVERLGEDAGVGGGAMFALVHGVEDLAEVAATPAGGIAIAAAAIVGLVAVEQLYENSINKVTVAVTAHGDALRLGTADYTKFASEIAAAADVSDSEGRVIVAAWVNAGAQSSQAMKSAGEALKGYEVLTGQTADQAVQSIGKMFTDPASAIDDLNKQYGFLSSAETAHIEHMQAEGNLAGAQGAAMDDLKSHVIPLADKTTALATAWDSVKKAMENALSWAGNHLQLSKNPFWSLLGVEDNGPPDAKKQVDAALAAVQAQDQAEEEAHNKLAQSVADYAGGYNDEAERKIIQGHIDAAHALLAEAQNAKETTDANHALAYAQQQLADLDKKSTDTKDKLTDAQRAYRDEINELINKTGPEAVALAMDDASALQAQAAASDGTALSIKNLQNAYDIAKAVQPYNTALQKAAVLYKENVLSASQYDAAVRALNSDIANITVAMKEQQQAQAEMEAKQQVRSGFEGLNNFYSSLDAAKQGIQADAAYIEQKSAEIRDMQIADLTATAQAQINNHDWSLGDWDHYLEHVLDILDNGVAKAYQDDAARQTAWAAGIKRGLTQLTNDQQNWAKTSESLVTGFSSEFEDTLVKMVEGGKNALGDFFTWVEEQLLKLMYQQYLASYFNSLFGSVVGDLGDILGIGGAGATASAGTGSGIVGVGVHHTGGVAGSPSVTRDVPLALFANAPRYHSGGIVGPGEVPIIAQEGERILTATQAMTVDAALSRPIVLQMPANANSNDRPFAVNIHEAPGTQARTQSTPGPNGSFSLDVFVDQIDKSLAQKSRKGRSALTQSLENTHGIRRAPIG
jgi:hypothetical protein